MSLGDQVVDVTGFGPGQWEWANQRIGEWANGEPATLSISATGLYTLSLYMREDGLRVDRLLLVTDTTPTVPSVEGPAETDRQLTAGGLIVPLSRTIVYTYDHLYRLTDADYSSGEVYTYTYDPAGNREQQTVAGEGATTYQYDDANRLTQVSGPAGSFTYVFDKNGNLTQTGQMTNTWDAANRLVETIRDNYTLEPLYNGVGDRVAQTKGTTTTNFALDIAGGLPEVIYTSDGNSYLHLPGVIITKSSTGEVRYLLSDGLGSVRQAVDEAGVVVAYNEFDPYGNPVENGSEPYGFTGEWWQDEVGLLHLRARWLMPESGTFLSRDPVKSEQHYLYVGGNPINGIDPTGLCEQGDFECWAVYELLIKEYPYLPREWNKTYPIPLHQLPTQSLQSLLTEPTAEIVAKASPNNVLGLIRLFEADHFPGKDARGRLEWILQITSSSIQKHLQFALFPEDDSGFCVELRDQWLYDAEDIWNLDKNSPQMGHFLTAVAFGYDPEGAYNLLAHILNAPNVIGRSHTTRGGGWPTSTQLQSSSLDPEIYALNLIVGHEMVGDIYGPFGVIGNIAQYYAATEEARSLFLQAIEADRRGESPDSYLRTILGDPLGRSEAIPGPDRWGNSMPDLRLTLKGWRFGQEVRIGYAPNRALQSREDAANWLKQEVYESLSTR